MSDFEAWPDVSSNSRMPSLADMLAKRLTKKESSATPTSTSTPDGFDPHKLMVQRKQSVLKGESTYGEDPKLPEVQKFPEEDVKALEDYCKKMGIVGFSTKHSPKLALIQLKRQMGDFEGIPLESRVIPGFEQVGIKSYIQRPNFPYDTIPQKKTLLSG